MLRIIGDMKVNKDIWFFAHLDVRSMWDVGYCRHFTSIIVIIAISIH